MRKTLKRVLGEGHQAQRLQAVARQPYLLWAVEAGMSFLRPGFGQQLDKSD